ncbi:hypothetical protein [Burkholderia sp. BE17]|uniref:hypothetical protein n=1 Tax=Burkholderia sp. BE17 TaxID=2656644 RepID=UPI00187BC027|nr:hypothetical protein [Burkholderia sp. BE17]
MPRGAMPGAHAVRHATRQYCIGGGVPGSVWSPCTPFGPGGGTSTGSPPGTHDEGPWQDKRERRDE